MPRKTVTKEVVLAAILDVVLGIVLLAGTVYVASVCLAPVG